ncbi:hypothetical protein FB451DRAFT_1558859 [Mycena latifolia]|nr:hypothetical protein FB451DRAFT_1558859 [Mycena latifolia]
MSESDPTRTFATEGSVISASDIQYEVDSVPVGEIANVNEVTPFAEDVNQFPAYYDKASVAACTWVDNGKVTGKPKKNPKDIVLYKSKLGPHAGRIVGLGIRKPSGVIEDLVRIDTDNSGKGIHFNAKYRKNTSKKLAAVITPTIHMTPQQRDLRYSEYLKALQNRSAAFIWTWWKHWKRAFLMRLKLDKL